MSINGLNPRYYRRVAVQDTDPEQVAAIELAALPYSRLPGYAPSTKQPVATATTIEDDSSQSRANLLLAKVRQTKRRFQGWRAVVVRSAWVTATVMVLNIFMTIIAATVFPTKGGVRTAYEGSCNSSSSITTGIHIVINALSSILLSASNYTMQAVLAPTREELNRAHARGNWMHVGVASVRNVFKIKWHRTILWFLLAISSVPIHLLFNSAVYNTVAANDYIAVVANPDWFKGGNFSTTIPFLNAPGGYSEYIDLKRTEYLLDRILDMRDYFMKNANNGSLVRNMSTSECISAYGPQYVSSYNHVVAITNERGTSSNQTLFFLNYIQARYNETGNGWMCDGNVFYCNVDDDHIVNPTSWHINGKEIDYCLSQAMPQPCSVRFSVSILAWVICMNAVKSLCMFFVAYRCKDTTLLTVGDAISSYLEEPDSLTAGRCLMCWKDVASWKLAGAKNKPNTDPLPRPYLPDKSRLWFAGASRSKWGVVLGSIGFINLVGILCVLLMLPGTFSWGWGRLISPRQSGPSEYPGSLISTVLLANMAQVAISWFYVMYNGLITSLLLASEWSNYAFERKALRVTTPRGAQRSTYYLQLPIKYSVPLLVYFAVLHWVVSDALFPASIQWWKDGVPMLSSQDSVIIVFSAIPLLTASIMGIILVVTALIMGFRKLSGAMPVAGSCSVAIAAACHRPEDDHDAAVRPVQWGEVKMSEGDGDDDQIAHCSFT